MSAPLVSKRFPYVPVSLMVGSRTENLEALLDTGFAGYVDVPSGFFQESERPDGSVIWSLADGSKLRAPFYHGSVVLAESAPIDVLITELGAEHILGLVGTNLGWVDGACL